MKNIILIGIIVTALFGCQDSSKIEVIPNHNVKFIPESKVTHQVKPKVENFEEMITDEFLKIINEINSEPNNSYVLYPIGYNLFINENGKVEKVEKIEAIEIEPKGEYIYNNENMIMDEITKKIIPIMEKWEFEPAQLFGNNVGMQKSIKALFAKNSKDEIVVKKPFDLSFDNFETEFFVAVEQMPSPIGGIGAIQKNIIYPEIAKRAGIEGRVFVKAFIDTLGNVVKTEIIRGIGAGCDEMSMEAVKKVKFKPGMQRGKAVNTQVTVPILFKLADSSNSEENGSNKKNISKIEVSDLYLKGLSQLEGKVISASSGLPLAASSIMLARIELGGATNHNGEFKIKRIPPGKHEIIISHPQYGTLKLEEIRFEANKLIKVDIKISPNSSIILGKWEGIADDGEIIKVTFFSNNTTELYKSKSGRSFGKVTSANFYPEYNISYKSIPYSLDFIYDSKTVLKSIVEFKSRNEIIVGLPKDLSNRPKNFNQDNVRMLWKLKRVK